MSLLIRIYRPVDIPNPPPPPPKAVNQTPNHVAYTWGRGEGGHFCLPNSLNPIGRLIVLKCPCRNQGDHTGRNP